MRRFLLVLLTALSLVSAAFAVEPDEMLGNPILEARARALSRTLRCMVCQNQSIDDSNAPLARDLRLLLRERLKAGDSDDQVRQFMVSRYGEFVLLRPPLNAQTLLLWTLPFVGLALAGITFLLAVRRRPHGLDIPLSAEEKRRLARLLGPDVKKM